jgi:hypothetical protein
MSHVVGGGDGDSAPGDIVVDRDGDSEAEVVPVKDKVRACVVDSVEVRETVDASEVVDDLVTTLVCDSDGSAGKDVVTVLVTDNVSEGENVPHQDCMVYPERQLELKDVAPKRASAVGTIPDSPLFCTSNVLCQCGREIQ